MTRVSEMAEHWFGLCRKPPLAHVSQAAFVYLPEPAHEGLPDGGGGRTGALRRGIGAALSGMKTLNRNRQLLWFTLLIGIVMAGTIICQGALCYIGWILSDEIVLRLVLDIFIEFVTLVCMVFFLAGLILSIAAKKDGAASFIEGLSGVKKNLKPLLLWSFILALAGMVLNRILFYPGGLFWPFWSFLTSTLVQYPFTLHLTPSTFAEVPGYGGRSQLFWTYPYGFENALEFFILNLFLLILTLFVVPLIVLEQKSLWAAVAGSFALMKKRWVEVTTCAAFLGVIVSGVYLTYLLVQAAHGMATPPELLSTPPTGIWLALGILYYLALFSIAFVMVTVGGIAALDLYRNAEALEGAP